MLCPWGSAASPPQPGDGVGGGHSGSEGGGGQGGDGEVFNRSAQSFIYLFKVGSAYLGLLRVGVGKRR